MKIEHLEGGYQIVRFSDEELKDLPKVGLGPLRELPPEIMAKIQRSLDKRAAQRENGAVDSPEPAAQAR